MKIVYVSRSIIPSRAANSINVMKMCSTFAGLGHEVLLLAPSLKKLEEKNVEDIFDYYGVEKNFKLKKIYSPNIKFLRKRIYSLQCMSVIKKQQPDLVYGRSDTLVFYLASQKGYPVSFERHDPYKGKGFNDYFFKKFIKTNTNLKLITNSEALKQMYMKDCNLKKESILAANNGTNIIPDEQTPENIQLNSKRIQVGYVGSLFKGRGIDIIIELSKRVPQADFHIIGGKDKDILFWQNQSTVENLYFHGFVEPKETYKYRNMCDILLAPYQSDGKGNRSSKYMSPIKLFEYMSSKRVIICSNFPVVYEALDEQCAVLVDSTDIEQWESALLNLIQDEEKRTKLALNAYNKFKEHFTWTARAQKILKYIFQ